MPTVTALRGSRGRVAVELDGAAWRSFPAAVVVAAGLSVGCALDRHRARSLARAARRQRAEDAALRALARRDHSRASLEARLARAGVAGEERRSVIESAERTGLVDDERYADARARQLANRGAGNLLVLDDLVRHGIDEHVAIEAVARLEPEPERAARIVAARGASVRTVRHLASRGFGEETLEGVIAVLESGAVR